MSKQLKIDSTDSLETAAFDMMCGEAAAVMLAREDPSSFTSYIMTDPVTKLNFYQDDIHVQGHKLISDWPWAMIEFPREHGKTEQYVIGRTIWELGHNPNLRIKIISNTDAEAMKRVSAIGQHIKGNAKVNNIFPDLKPDTHLTWRQHAITVKRDLPGVKDYSVEGFGILSGGTGTRADVIIFDDVVDFENTIKNPALIEKVKDAYFEKWINLLTEYSKNIYVFTRWHERDLSHDLIRNHAKLPKDKPKREEYAYIKFIINENLDSICRLWPKERLIARRNSIGKRAFARNFQGRAMTDEEAIFGFLDNYLDWGYDTATIPEQWMRFTGVDVGHRQKSDSAYFAIFTGAISPERKKIPIEIERGRWGPGQAGDRIIAHALRHKSKTILVENNAAQEMLIDWIKEKCQKQNISLPIRGFFTGKQKMDEEVGLPAMAVDMENGNWVIPMNGKDHDRHGEPCRCGICIWREEMKAWPVSEYFDTGMASWLFWNLANGYHYGRQMVRTSKPRRIVTEMKDYGVPV